MLYTKKKLKKSSNDQVEIDLVELEQFSNFTISSDFYQIASAKIDEKTILDWFSLDKISYWWLFVTQLSGKYDEGTSFIDRFIGIIKHYNPKIIELHGLFDKIDIIQQICKNFNIKLNYSYLKYIEYITKQKTTNIIKKYTYKRITLEKHKKRLQCIKGKKFHIPKKDFVLFTSHQSYLRDSFNPKNNTSKKEEHVLQPILDLCYDENVPLLCFDLDYTFKGRTDVLVERLDSKYNWLPIEFLLKNKKKQITKKQITKLKKSISDLINKDLTSTIVYKKISLWHFLKPTFKEFLFEPYLPTYLHLISILEEFLAKNRPKTIIQLYEVGPFAKSFEIAAKKLGIKTIGIQHGNMIGVQTDYMHKEIQKDETPLGNPIADLTFVFGEFHKKLLTEEGNFPKDRIVITGNPSLLKIKEILSTINRDEILEKNGVLNKKIILVPLSLRFKYRHDVKRDNILLDILYKQFKNNSDVIVLVRPHPGDDFTQKTLDKLYPGFLCSKKSLTEDLILANVVVATMTSVGIDAVYYEKPVIFTKMYERNQLPKNFNDIIDMMIKTGVARYVENEKLIDEINSILKKGFEYDSKKRDEFIQYFFGPKQTPDLLKLITQ